MELCTIVELLFIKGQVQDLESPRKLDQLGDNETIASNVAVWMTGDDKFSKRRGTNWHLERCKHQIGDYDCGAGWKSISHIERSTYFIKLEFQVKFIQSRLQWRLKLKSEIQ